MVLMTLLCLLSLVDLIQSAPALHKISAIPMTNNSSESYTMNLSTALPEPPLSPPGIPWVDLHARESQYAFSAAMPSLRGLGPAKAIWVAPAKMDDLTPFGVADFPKGGRKNLQIVTAESDNSTSILQLFFPAGSIAPARKPQGGAEFYAIPLDISKAQNVTLEYSVFFPANFDFVLAGKLPGLYGGHTGCSGGNAALDCFSTRLMWREEGAGELYLYAPKDKQTEALGSDPGSICEATYGLSIGRGSFTWATGNWTTIQQTVVLNTPGMQDGRFMLNVNGQRVIDRADVMYRDELVDKDSDEDPSPEEAPTSTKRVKPTSTSGSTKGDGGLLGPLLDGLLQGLKGDTSVVSTLVNADPVPTTSESGVQPTATISPAYMSNNLQATPTATASLDNNILTRSSSNEEVGFIGIFFSTFFGGHSDKYATPRDQYIWFKDFALAYNS